MALHPRSGMTLPGCAQVEMRTAFKLRFPMCTESVSPHNLRTPCSMRQCSRRCKLQMRPALLA